MVPLRQPSAFVQFVAVAPGAALSANCNYDIDSTVRVDASPAGVARYPAECWLAAMTQRDYSPRQDSFTGVALLA
jgi:hypothetical protein